MISSIIGDIVGQSKQEATGNPYFVIVKNTRGGMALLKGVWFSREKAERHLQNKRYNYGKDAYVYCPSGNGSDLERLYEAAKVEQVEEVK